MKHLARYFVCLFIFGSSVFSHSFAQEQGRARVISAKSGNFAQHWYEPQEVCRNEAMYAPIYSGSYGFGSPLVYHPYWNNDRFGYGQSFGLGYSQQYVGTQRVCRTEKVRFEKAIPDAYQVTYIYRRKAYTTVMSGYPSEWIDVQALRLPPFAQFN